MKKKGYYFTVGVYGYFLISDKRVRNDNLAREMLHLIASYSPNVNKYLDLYLDNRTILEYIKLNMSLSTLEKVITENGYVYMSIQGEHFTCNFPLEDFQKEVRVG